VRRSREARRSVTSQKRDSRALFIGFGAASGEIGRGPRMVLFGEGGRNRPVDTPRRRAADVVRLLSFAEDSFGSTTAADRAGLWRPGHMPRNGKKKNSILFLTPYFLFQNHVPQTGDSSYAPHTPCMGQFESVNRLWPVGRFKARSSITKHILN